MTPADTRRALVTGGSTGVGLAVARRLARDGVAVTIVSHDQESLRGASSTLQAEGLSAQGICADVSVADQIQHAVDRCAGGTGIDAVVNSAGIQTYGTVEDTTEEMWDRTLDVNVKGMFLTSKYAARHLRARGGGAIVNVSSVQASASQANVAAYSASKGAICALTRSMTIDLAGDGIRVNSVSPGSVDTPMLRATAESIAGPGASAQAVVDEWGRGHPLGRVGQPDDVAAMICFLLGPDAGFVTGADIRVDGGLLAGLALQAPRDEG